MTSVLTSRKRTSLCLVLFHFLPASMHPLPKFYLDLQPIFTSSSSLRTGLLAFQGHRSTLDLCPFFSTRSGALTGHLFSCLQSFPLCRLLPFGLSIHAICLHFNISLPLLCLPLALVLFLPSPSSERIIFICMFPRSHFALRFFLIPSVY